MRGGESFILMIMLACIALGLIIWWWDLDIFW